MTPVRLNKKTNQNSSYTIMDRIEAWVLRHANILMPLCLITLIVLFVLLCYAICGVSAVESGNVYNHFGDVI